MCKIKNIIEMIFVALVMLTSCSQEGKNPIEDIKLEKGAFPQFEALPPVAMQATGSFSAKVIDYHNNIDQVTYAIKYTPTEGKVIEKKDVLTMYDFPYELNLTADDLASFLNKRVSDFSYGDKFELIGRAIRNDGVVFVADAPKTERQDDGTLVIVDEGTGKSYQNLVTGGYRQALKFEWFYSCPFSTDDAVGIYEIIEDSWEISYMRQFEVIKGSEPNQVIAKNPMDIGYDMTMTVDEKTGIITIDPQEQVFDAAKHTGGQYTGGYFKADRNSFFFSCLGVIDITFTPFVDQGAGDSGQKFVAKKM